MKIQLTRVIAFFLCLSCHPAPVPTPVASTGLDEAGFTTLMKRLAEAWSMQDTEQGLSCFAEDAIYMQPPEEQLYRGHGDLRKLFAAVKPGTRMELHGLAFDERAQVGFGKFTFGRVGEAKADHGAVVVELRDGRIGVWREYFKEGPARFSDFIAVEGKKWKWTGAKLSMRSHGQREWTREPA